MSRYHFVDFARKVVGVGSVGTEALMCLLMGDRRDMKRSFDVTTMTPEGLEGYARLCGGVLARAHARTGDAAGIAGYLGVGDEFDRAMVDFGVAYARQTTLDHAALEAAAASGRVSADHEHA